VEGGPTSRIKLPEKGNCPIDRGADSVKKAERCSGHQGARGIDEGRRRNILAPETEEKAESIKKRGGRKGEVHHPRKGGGRFAHESPKVPEEKKRRRGEKKLP